MLLARVLLDIRQSIWVQHDRAPAHFVHDARVTVIGRYLENGWEGEFLHLGQLLCLTPLNLIFTCGGSSEDFCL